MIDPLDGLEPIAEFGSRFEADAAAARLETEGIEAAVLGDPGSSIAPHHVNVAGFSVVVLPQDVIAARAVLDKDHLDDEEPNYTRFGDRSASFKAATVVLVLIFVVPLLAAIVIALGSWLSL